MRLRLHVVDIQLVIKDFDVQHRAKQRFVARRFTAIADNLLGIVALMAAHFFQLPGETRRQLRQRLLRIDIHRQRQYVEYRAGGGQRRRSHAAHKDKASRVIHAAAQPPQPQRRQRQRQIGTLALRRAGCELAEDSRIGLQFQAPDIAAGRPAGQRRV